MSDSTSATGVAGRYALALFDLAEETESLDAVDQQLGLLEQALGASEDLRKLIDSPVYARDEQARAMAAVCAAIGVTAPTANLVGLMAQKRRLFALPAVIRAYRARLAARRGVVTAEVTTPKPLTDAQQQALSGAIRASSGADVTLAITIDETLIGGLVVKVGSKMIDTSIRSKLDRLQTAMKETAL